MGSTGQDDGFIGPSGFQVVGGGHRAGAGLVLAGAGQFAFGILKGRQCFFEFRFGLFEARFRGAQPRFRFAAGTRVEERRGLFLKPPQVIGSDLPGSLGCELTDTGHLATGPDHQTSVRGVYAAGDAASPFQQVVLAAASGAHAAITLNRDLAQEDFAAAAAGG